MSRPSTPYDMGPFFGDIGQETLLHSMQQGGRFHSGEVDDLIFAPNQSQISDGLDSTFNRSLTNSEASNPSTGSTPSFSNFAFSHPSPTYSTPGPNYPQPYPLETHYQFQNHGQSSLPIRAQTNQISALLQRPNPSAPYARRRSLSHGDADRLVPAAGLPKPTFVRMSAPRAPRPTVIEDGRRSNTYHNHGRSVSQGPGARGRPLKCNGMKYHAHEDQMMAGMISMPIGTPMDEDMTSHSQASVSGTHNPGEPMYPQSRALPQHNEPVLERMVHPADLARSKHIIQIGAMAVVNRARANVDPRILAEAPGTGVLRKLDDVERHLSSKYGVCEEALRACTTIREALTKNGAGHVDLYVFLRAFCTRKTLR